VLTNIPGKSTLKPSVNENTSPGAKR
jgi:hypothetical protein